MMFDLSSGSVRSFLKEEWKYVRLSVSFIFIISIAVLMAFVTLIFAGQIDQAHLAGVGLANTLYNILICSVSTGYSSVFDTYGPQVHGSGKSNPGELGTVLQKCLLQGLLVNLFIAGPYLNIVYIIDLLPESGLYPESSGQEIAETAQDFKDIAAVYLRIVLLVQYLDYAVMMLSKYFAIQGYNRFVYLIFVVMLGTHVLYNYLLVNVLQLDVIGIGLSAILSRLTPLAVSLTVCFVMVKKGQFAWNGFTLRAFLGWKPMIKLGVSGAINFFAEMALFEISIFFSQFDGTNALSVVIIIMQLSSALWSIVLGMSRAGATLIGAALAEGNADKTRYYMKLAILNTLVLSSILSIISYSFRSYEVKIFSSDDNVDALFVRTYWIFCVLIPIDHIQTVLNQGILVAFGAQKFTAWSMSIACYVIGLPIILMTIFLTDLIVTGVFIGVIVVATIMIVAASVKIWTVDIDKEIEISSKRAVGKEEKQNDDTAEIHGNPAVTMKYDASESTVREETMENARTKEADKDGSKTNDADGSLRTLKEEGIKNVNSKELKHVAIAFAAALTFAVTLAGVSFIRDRK